MPLIKVTQLVFLMWQYRYVLIIDKLYQYFLLCKSGMIAIIFLEIWTMLIGVNRQSFSFALIISYAKASAKVERFLRNDHFIIAFFSKRCFVLKIEFLSNQRQIWFDQKAYFYIIFLWHRVVRLIFLSGFYNLAR